MKKIFLLSILTLIFIPLLSVNADIGPKPTADFFIRYNAQPIPDKIFYARMIDCKKKGERFIKSKNLLQSFTEWANSFQEDKNIEKEIKQLNVKKFDIAKRCYWQSAELARGGECKNSSCNFGYMIPNHFKLLVYIPSLEKTFITREMDLKGFYSKFELDIKDTGKNTLIEYSISNQGKKMKDFSIALILTILIELSIALLYLKPKKLKLANAGFNKYILSIFAINIVSLPFVWFIFPALIKHLAYAIYGAEIFVLLFESGSIYFLNKKFISYKESLGLALMMNIASFVLGGLIFSLIIFLTY